MADQDKTNNALLDQLVYIDNFISEDHNNLNFDLSAFADDSFIFADEEKAGHNDIDNLDNNNNSNDNNSENNGKFDINNIDVSNLTNLPRFPVPPGAKDSLVEAGLNQNQIDLLSALIAQYQSVQNSSQNPLEPEPMNDNLNFAHSDEFTQSAVPLGNESATQNGLNHHIHHDSFYDIDFSHDNNNVSDHINNGSTIGENDLIGHVGSNSSNASITPTSLDKDGMDNDLDKRRRNTAASARFRIKKKLKEKQMEEKIGNLTDLIRKFESKIDSLELENKLLKKVINDQGSEKSDYELKLLKERILNEN